MNRTMFSFARLSSCALFLCSAAFAFLSLASVAEAQVKPRILVIVDTSGSMRWDLDGVYTWGDGVGATECERGLDTNCDTQVNDSRMQIAKEAVANIVRAYGDVEWSLARFSQTQQSQITDFDEVCRYGGGSRDVPSIESWLGNPQCHTGSEIDSASSCYWPYYYINGASNIIEGVPTACRPGAGINDPARLPTSGNPDYYLNYVGGSGPSGGPCNPTGADVLVGWPGLGAFSSKGNESAILKWLDGVETNPQLGSITEGNVCNHAASGDCELRATGKTPLGESLEDAADYIMPIRGADVKQACRPYSIILITDGIDTCGGDPSGAAQSLAQLNPTIATYVIGMSIASTSDENNLNDIAVKGGTTSAYFADNQDKLAAALSDIVRRSLLIEVCNGADDDCDDLIDEGFTKYCNRPAGVTGLTLCNDPGERVCDMQDDNCDGETDEGVLNACGTCGAVPVEVCDGVDNDCDIAIDEMSVCDDCVASEEICDGLDNDCDNKTDESISRICGNDVGECKAGTQTCTNGTWGACTGTTPTAELCDGKDNDCDGVVDGMVRSCGQSAGACQPGSQTCTNGNWGGCIGQIGPSDEVCDGQDNDCNGTIDDNVEKEGEACGSGMCAQGMFECVNGSLICMGMNAGGAETCNDADDDCDGKVDEGLGLGDACGSSTGDCRPGTRICQGGQVVCSGGVGTEDEVCDLRDNDCDGVVDEDLQSNETCGSNEGQCMQGTVQCVRGQSICVGEVPPGLEVCDCEDNDCDGEIDENPEAGGLCPGDSACLGCQCAGPCQGAGEFGQQCPPGRAAVESEQGCYCVADKCDDAQCALQTVTTDDVVRCAPDSEGVSVCTCKNNACTFSCEGVVCPEGTICNPRDPQGRCEEDSCRGLGCAEGELCNFVTGACEVDPCADMDCGEQACRDGVCETPCALVECSAGQTCSRGACAVDACAGVACDSSLEFCDPADGVCKNNPCRGVRCPSQSVCDPTTGMCEPDPCASLHCPGELLCIDGECLSEEPTVETPDAGVVDAGGTRVLASGSGCTCAVEQPSPRPLWLGLLVLGLLAFRRKHRAGTPVGFRHPRGSTCCLKTDTGGSQGSPHLQAAAELTRTGVPARLTTIVLALIGSLGCDVEPYCIDCEELSDGRVVPKGDAKVDRDATTVPDASLPDAEVDAALPGTEVCNGQDEDNDGKVDETFDLQADPRNCGSCGTECAIANAFSECREGTCAFTMCDVGFYDLNGDEADGCEYRCLPRAENDAKCDLVDEDCDGKVDEDIDKTSDAINCGECGRRCIFGNAQAACVNSMCVLSACDEGYVDLDGQPGTGCEYACTKVSEQETACDLEDDDCDGIIDEGNPQGGAACGETRGECTAGTQVCTAGTLACQNAGLPKVEACDNKDNDCDGKTDESLTAPNNFCNPNGVCGGSSSASCAGAQGWTCNYGADYEENEATCDSKDNDCDGKVDEGFPVGDACDNGRKGECNRRGVRICDATGTATVCNAMDIASGSSESCDGKDNDCDGDTDEGMNTTTIATVPFTNRNGRNMRIMAYEASRPDADDTQAGSMNTVACSTEDHLPWTNVTWQQARDACCALNPSGNCISSSSGWYLCSASDWEDACEANNACTWGYDNNCASTQPLVCNGEEHDSSGSSGDQDRLYTTGSSTFPACFADLPNGDVFDMSGNVKEWTSTQRGSSSVHEIRGGSYNNVESGRTCQFSFTAGNNQFQFPNTGFRCCLY